MVNLNKISHKKISDDLKSGKILENADNIIKKHSKLLENLYKYDKSN
ncbi:MAG: hypothetical protein HRU03_06925 [Nanoarchaeales archaeon]|nr:hypothetical protein [Nanoarchaeales archaeon]